LEEKGGDDRRGAQKVQDSGKKLGGKRGVADAEGPCLDRRGFPSLVFFSKGPLWKRYWGKKRGYMEERRGALPGERTTGEQVAEAPSNQKEEKHPPGGETGQEGREKTGKSEWLAVAWGVRKT